MPLTKVSYSMIDAAPANVQDFGAVGDGITDDTAAIQSAIDYVSANSMSLYFPPAVYRHTGTLQWKNNARYYSDKINVSNTKGAVLKYEGSDNANVINNPVNTATFASIRIEGINFLCNSLASGKALFYATASYYVYIEYCKFSFAGVGAFGLVFHQTAVSTITRNIFEATGNIGLGALIRLADGPVMQHPTAIQGYTNRITVTENQINPALGGAQAIGIWDDGGIVHTYKDNNLNGGNIAFYILRPYPVEIMANQIEGYTGSGISLAFPGAGVTGLRIVGNYFIGLPAALDFANDAIAEMTYTDNIISVLTPGGSCENNISGSPNAKIFAANNREVSDGNNPFNNYLQKNVDTVGTMLLAGSTTAGTQTYFGNTMTWRLIGDVCFFNAYIVMTNKDPATAGEIRLTGLPFPHRLASTNVTAVTLSFVGDITFGAGYTQLSGYIVPGESNIRLVRSGSGVGTAFLTASGIANTSQLMVSGMYPL